jgi:NADH-quinone oxidoreductase subunit J
VIETLIFLLFAGLALGSALVVVLHKNPIYSTMSLVVTLISIAVLFVLLGAPFIAALQVLIYTGAIVVLFLFVVMLLNIGREEIAAERGLITKAVAAGGALLFLLMTAAALWQASSGAALDELTPEFVSLRVLAAELFGRYLLTFELVGLLLLVAVIAATVLAARAQPGQPLAADSGAELHRLADLHGASGEPAESIESAREGR